MCCYLPQSGFKWVNPERFNIDQVTDTDDIGYFLEVDLSTPLELHDKFRSYPLAPESKTVPEEKLTDYNKNLLKELGTKADKKTKKLILDLEPKKNYVVHYMTLKRYIQLGMKLEKIHRILSFNQSPFMKSYIEMNSELRMKATNSFEVAFFKLMNNSLFGKCMENLRKHVNVDLVIHEDKLIKKVACPTFKSFRIMSGGLAAVQRSKEKLVLNKPIYIGMAVLDLSKELMYNFFYNILREYYGEENIYVAYTDTDSLIMAVKGCDNFLKSLEPIREHFDFSNFPRDHEMYSTSNKKVPGKMKIETADQVIHEFVGLKPKMYSLLYGDKEMKRAKGVSSAVLNGQLRHKSYVKCLKERKRFRNKMRRIGSTKHDIYTIEQEKVSLSPYYDKAMVLDDGIQLLPYGYKQI